MKTKEFLNKHKGLYTFKSPYHKNKRLHFSIVGESFDHDFPIQCNTVQYRGWKKEDVSSGYQIDGLLKMINTGYLKPTS
jgi:hypothetical protein